MMIQIHTLVTVKQEIGSDIWEASDSMLGDVVVSGRKPNIQQASTYSLFLPVKHKPVLLWTGLLEDDSLLLTVSTDLKPPDGIKYKPLPNLIVEPTKSSNTPRMIVKTGKITWTIKDC